MTSIAVRSVKIQTTPQPNPSTPCWFGELVVISRALRKHHNPEQNESKSVLRAEAVWAL